MGSPPVSITSKVLNALSLITVEPVMIAYALGCALYYPLYQQMFEERVCTQEFQYSAAVCANLTTHPVEMARVRGEWAVWNWYASAIQVIPAIVFVLFVGPWSDRFGRRVMMLSAPTFAIFAAIQLLINTYWPTLPMWNLLLVEVIDSVSGGFLGVLAASMSYVADMSEPGESRTLRIAMVDTSIRVGGFVGLLIGSRLIKNYTMGGQAAVFYAYLGASVFNVVYILVRVKETRGTEGADSRMSVGEKARELFRLGHLKGIWEMMMRKREASGRKHLWMIFSGFMLYCLFAAESSIGQPFLEFPPISFTLSYFMFFSAVVSLMGLVFNFTVFPLVTKVYPCRKSSLLLIGGLAKVTHDFLYYLARNSTWIWAAEVVYSCGMFSIVSVRSLVSGTVSGDEQGSVFAVVAVLEKAMPVFGGFGYAALFRASQQWGEPSLAFGVAAALICVPLSMYAALHLDILRGERKVRRKEAVKA